MAIVIQFSLLKIFYLQFLKVLISRLKGFKKCKKIIQLEIDSGHYGDKNVDK